jgi:hypothetical protein
MASALNFGRHRHGQASPPVTFRMEYDVRNANLARDASPHALETEDTVAADLNTRFTPGQFFREAGMIIAVCLGLGLLFQLLLG